MDFEKALLDPSGAFVNPKDILSESSLSRDQKIELLHRWEYDARELAVAEEENMGGGPPDRLAEVLEALHELRAGIDSEHTPPTKQG